MIYSDNLTLQLPVPQGRDFFNIPQKSGMGFSCMIFPFNLHLRLSEIGKSCYNGLSCICHTNDVFAGQQSGDSAQAQLGQTNGCLGGLVFGAG